MELKSEFKLPRYRFLRFRRS